MSLAYLPEYLENALMALDVAEREARHLAYTTDTLFSQKIDLQWVENIASRDDLAEKIDALVGRFGRLQDHIGEKLLPRFAQLMGEQPRSLLDNLAFAERMGWVKDAEVFIGARKLRNQLIHEYMTDASLFLEALLASRPASEMLQEIVANVRGHAKKLHISAKTTKVMK